MADQAARYVALLRGIAPGGKNMSNALLRGVAEQLGYLEVGSVITSGNVTFTLPAAQRGPEEAATRAELERAIEAGLQRELGLTSKTLVRSLPQLQALLASDPFEGLEHSTATYLTVTFVRAPRDPLILGEQPYRRVHVIGYHAPSQAVLSVADNSEPGAARRYLAWLEREYGTAITTRSWPTVHRIMARMAV